jgi:hypothetical protein
MLKRTLLTTVISLFLGLMPAALISNPASAESSDGAEHSHFEGCVGFFCYTTDSLANVTRNKNVMSLFIHEEETYSYDDGVCRRTGSTSEDSHYLVKLDQQPHSLPHVSTQALTRWTQSEPGCNDPAPICTFTSHYVLANEATRHSTFDVTCTNP